MVRVGIVGCGIVGMKHAEVYQAEGARVMAVADVLADKRSGLATRWGATAYADPVEMIECETLDLVSVCSPPDAHPAAVLAASRKNCHVFCEKPMAMNLRDACAMYQACREAKVAFGMGFKMRYEAVFAAAKRAILEGRIGQPELVYISYFQPKPKNPWFLEVGALRDTVVHAIDMAAWFLDREPARVHARLERRFNPKAEDLVHLWLDFPKGHAGIGGGYFQEFPPVAASDDICFQVLGTRGYVLGRRPNRITLTTSKGVEEQTLEIQDGFRAEIAAFLAALTKDPSTIPVTGWDGLRSQAVIEAAYASAVAERPVAVTVPS
jgi:myo-inositol 2-dehydrogenase / D-chiro-inositol 1-dehydrogenase